MKTWIPAALVIGLLVAVACSSGSTTEPEGGDQVFTGQVAYQEPAPTINTFVMTDTAIVRVEIVQLLASAGDLEIPEEYTVSLGFRLGFPVGDECRPTYQATVVEGSQFSFQLTANEYCLVLFDAGALLPQIVVDYTMSLTGE